jgi:NADPH:quinone reductase-like Zn-dependent oxidoreductase
LREVLIQVRANSLNSWEISVLRGTYPLPVKPDVVMGADGAGEVVAVGTDVSRVHVGDRVAVTMFPRWLDGPFAWEFAAICARRGLSRSSRQRQPLAPQASKALSQN